MRFEDLIIKIASFPPHFHFIERPLPPVADSSSSDDEDDDEMPALKKGDVHTILASRRIGLHFSSRSSAEHDQSESESTYTFCSTATTDSGGDASEFTP